MSGAEDIGIVVIGRNEGQRLVDCLRSLGAGARAIVYVDSGSNDGSAVRARSLGAHVVPLDLSVPFTAARARNEGYATARARAPDLRFVQFVDGDCRLAPDWLDTAARFLSERPDVAVVCGRRREIHPDASVYNRLIDEEWDTPIGEAAACGGDALMRVAAFDAAGGFDAGLMAGEEPELCSRLREAGWRIWRLDAPMTAHDAALHRFRQWWLRAVRSGFGYAQVWSATRRRPIALYGRELLRACMWAGALPLAILAGGAIFAPAIAIGISLYVLQVVRLAAKRGPGKLLSWTYAATTMLGKFAELGGAASFLIGRARRISRSSIDYKAA